MEYSVKLSKEDADWLENLMQTGLEKAARLEGGWGNHVERLLGIQEALQNKKGERSAPVARAPRRSSDEVAMEKKQALCAKHPTNQLKRRPQTDCESCWDAYKRLEPMKYAKARRDFELKQRKKTTT